MTDTSGATTTPDGRPPALRRNARAEVLDLRDAGEGFMGLSRRMFAFAKAMM